MRLALYLKVVLLDDLKVSSVLSLEIVDSNHFLLSYLNERPEIKELAYIGAHLTEHVYEPLDHESYIFCFTGLTHPAWIGM